MNDPQHIVQRLRDASQGRYVWRVQDKTTKAYCMEFSEFERWEAEA